MTTNEIKKALIKKNPVAVMKCVRMGNIHYYSDFLLNTIYPGETVHVHVDFIVPVNDIGEADFLLGMNAKELIRWMQWPDMNRVNLEPLRDSEWMAADSGYKK